MTDQKCLQCGSPLGHDPVSFFDNYNPAAGACHLRCVDAYHAQRKGVPMVTDKTITRFQIDAVYISAQGPGTIMQADADLMQACTVARNTHGDFTHAEQAAARQVVAAAYNARVERKAETAASAATAPELDIPLEREPGDCITAWVFCGGCQRRGECQIPTCTNHKDAPR